MASSQHRSKSVEKKRAESRLVDTHTKQSRRLEDGGRLLIVSHAHLENLEGYEHVHKTLQLPPTIERDVYCAEVMVQAGKSTALVCVHRGTCYVNGEEMKEGEKPRKMKNGTFLDLGASYQFQYLSSKVSSNSPVKRVLPQTPGQALNGKPPSKPPRQQITKTKVETSAEGGQETSTSYSYSGSVDLERSAINEGLRARLKRIAKEIASRASGYQDRKPPPPYEQVGNSIGYQLLHQNHNDVTTELIDRLYPALKELEMKDPSLTESYTSYVMSYDEAREAGATPQCMLPGDIPTINFITDVVVNLCCIPQTVSLSEKYAALFASVLAVLSSSSQNQSEIAAQRHTTKILSCMNLTIMANVVEFQQHGWTLLANTLDTPSTNNKKPLLSEASLTLALSLIEQQLSSHHLDLELSLSIIKFLSVVAATAKRCTQTESGRDEAPPIYTPTQASGIICLLNDTKILRHVMKVPQEIRSDPCFDRHYSVVVKCLAPTRTKRKLMIRRGTTSDLLETPTPPSPTAISTPPPISTAAAPSVSTPSVPPPKPKRMFRHRRSTVGAHSRNENSKNKGQTHFSTSLTVPNGHVTTSKEQATDHVTTPEEEVPDLPTSTVDHQANKTELNSTSGISTESDLYSLSCSALPDKTSACESYNQDLPQSISAPELPQREQEEGRRREDDQEKPIQELVKPVSNEEKPVKLELEQELPVEQDQEKIPDKSKLEEPVRPDKVVQQEPVEPVKPELEQKESELTQKENEATNDEEAPTENALVEGEQDRDSKQDDQINEITETKAMNKIRNDIIVSSDDVTTKEETADISTVMPDCEEVDASTAESEQPDSNVQATHESRVNDDEKAMNDDDGRDDKVQLVGEEGCSQADSKQNDTQHKEKLVDRSEECRGNSHSTLSVEVKEKGEEGADVDTQRDTPSSHISSETPPTIPKASSPASEAPPTTLECPLKAGASTLGENSPSHSVEQTATLIGSPTASRTTADQPSQISSTSLETETPPSDATYDQTDTHPNLGTSPNSEQFSTPDNSLLSETEREKSDSLILQSQDPPTVEEPPNIQLHLSCDISVLEEREKSTALSPEPPWSPNTASLAKDVQDLLSAVQAPLEEEQMVRVPSISRNSRYYRVSVKGSTPKSSRRGQEEGSTPKMNRHDQKNTGAGDSPSDRSQWGCGTPPSLVRGHAEASPFEVSGEFLSSTHQAIEDIVSGHEDMKDTLQARLEVASGVVGLWHRDKGLQASTNLVQACFSSGKDLVLFIDILQQLLKHQSPWTLAVCFVMLPVLRQLLTTQTEERCVSVVCDVLLMILNRFSELILFSKSKSRTHPSRRLSSTIDRQQQEVCYNELHNIRKNLHSRLDQNCDTVTVSNYLRKLHAALKQYKEPLDEN